MKIETLYIWSLAVKRSRWNRANWMRIRFQIRQNWRNLTKSFQYQLSETQVVSFPDILLRANFSLQELETIHKEDAWFDKRLKISYQCCRMLKMSLANFIIFLSKEFNTFQKISKNDHKDDSKPRNPIYWIPILLSP